MSRSKAPTYFMAAKRSAGQAMQRQGWAGLGRLWRAARDCRGSLLLEAVIASSVFALVGTAVLSGLSTTYRSGSITEEQSVAEHIARNQMESIFDQVYREPDQTPYPTIDLASLDVPPSYSVSTVATHLTGDTHPEVEKLSLTVNHGSKEVLVLETVRYRNDGMRLAYSASPDRTNRKVLVGATITDDPVYVFLDDPELLIDEVEFFLDGLSIRTEYYLNWDFKGSEGNLPSDPANPWNTAPDGDHTILAQALLTSGETINVTADFTISN